MDIKEIEGIVDKGFEGFESKVDAKFQKQFEAGKAEIVKEITEKGYQSSEQVENLIKEKTADLEAAVLDLKKAGIKTANDKPMSLKELMQKGMTDQKTNLSAIKEG